MQFSNVQYVGSEASGFLSVELMVSGGTLSSPLNVTVTPSELSPPSAIGQFYNFYMMLCGHKLFDAIV